jgi:hypothetical protein
VIAGHSGDEVTVDGARGVVRKRARGHRAARLYQAMLRQQEFVDTDRCYAPPVLDFGTEGDSFWFEMSLVRGEPPLDVARVAALVEWVQANITASTVMLDPVVVVTKLDGACAFHECATAFARRVLLSGSVALPAGYSHGDLTLCNVLVTGRRFALIDFLPPLADSPVLDLVKLQQDTRHGWVTLFAECCLAQLVASDLVVTRALERCVDAPVAAALQVLNLARIVPYTRSATVADLLHKEMTRCITPFC